MHADTVCACVRNTISSLPQIDIADLQSTTGDPAFISNISVTAAPASTTYRIFYSADPCSGSTLQQLTTKRDNLTVSLRCTWTPLQRYCISSPQLAFSMTPTNFDPLFCTLTNAFRTTYNIKRQKTILKYQFFNELYPFLGDNPVIRVVLTDGGKTSHFSAI